MRYFVFSEFVVVVPWKWGLVGRFCISPTHGRLVLTKGTDMLGKRSALRSRCILVLL